MRPGLTSVIISGAVALTLVGATALMFATSRDGGAQPSPAAAPPATLAPAPIATATIAPTSTRMVVAAAADGRTLFQRKGCIGCHSVTAAGLTSPLGFAPELSALPQVAPTRRPGMTADAYVRESIRFPQAYRVPGFTDVDMPTLPVSDAELEALVAFLLSDHR